MRDLEIRKKAFGSSRRNHGPSGRGLAGGIQLTPERLGSARTNNKESTGMAARGMNAKKKDKRRRHAKSRRAATEAAAAQDRPQAAPRRPATPAR